MPAVVTLNSRGVAVQGTGASAAPVPPLANCLNKLVVLVIAQSSQVPTVSGITGANYFLAENAGPGQSLRCYLKNGQASEPTPNIGFANMAGAFMAQIFVLDIAGGRFPVISADGQGVLASSAPTDFTAQTALVYLGNGNLIGNGCLIQIAKKNTAAGGLPSGVALTAGYTQVGLGLPTAVNRCVMAAQMLNATTTAGGTVPANTATITNNSDSGAHARITLELALVTAVSPGIWSMDNANDRLVVASDPGLDGATRLKLRAKFPVLTSAAADWTARTNGPGVVWHHNFDVAAEVNNFRWSGNYGSGNDPLALGVGGDQLVHVASGGADGGGYLRKTVPANGSGQNSYWWRPLTAMNAASTGRSVADPVGSGANILRPNGSTMSPQNYVATNAGAQQSGWAAGANPGWYGHSSYAGSDAKFDGTDFYIQVRCLTDPRRTLQNTDPGSYPHQATGKHVWITSIQASYSFQELVTNQKYTDANIAQAAGIGNYHNGYFGQSLANHGAGALTQYLPWGDGATAGVGTRIQIGSGIAGVCDPYNSVNSGCWAFATNGTWDTLLYHVTPGRASVVEGRLEVWAAHAGQTSYTKIWDIVYAPTFYTSANTDANARNGWSSLILGGYNNGFIQPQDFWIGYDQVIFSKQPIACPQV